MARYQAVYEQERPDFSSHDGFHGFAYNLMEAFRPVVDRLCSCTLLVYGGDFLPILRQTRGAQTEDEKEKKCKIRAQAFLIFFDIVEACGRANTLNGSECIRQKQDAKHVCMGWTRWIQKETSRREN